MTTKELDYARYSQLMGGLIRKLNLLDKDQKFCYGLTVSQCYTVETLGERGRLSMNQLSRELGTAISTVTRVVDVLVRDDIVTRVPSPEDRRKVCIQLTPKGIDLEEKLKQCSEDYSREILGAVPMKNREQVLRALELLNRAVEKVHGEKCCK